VELLRDAHGSTDGSGLGIACADDRFDPLTCIGGVISMQNGALTQNLNIRYPTAITGGRLTDILSAKAEARGARFAPRFDAKPFYISPGSAPIGALMDAYRQVSGKQSAPFTMGGGTYARHFKNAVSYGPGEMAEARPAFAAPEHSPNEGVCAEGLMRALKIYLLALWKLQQLAPRDFTV
jgi:succinyl-diaminopimelate desuccinylase